MNNPENLQSQPSSYPGTKRKSMLYRSIHAIRWYLMALVPFLVFGSLSVLHAYRAMHMEEPNDLVLSPEQILASADLLLLSGIIFSGCLLAMVAMNDLFSFFERLIKRAQ